jgi:hypothetical protein
VSSNSDVWIEFWANLDGGLAVGTAIVFGCIYTILGLIKPRRPKEKSAHGVGKWYFLGAFAVLAIWAWIPRRGNNSLVFIDNRDLSRWVLPAGFALLIIAIILKLKSVFNGRRLRWAEYPFFVGLILALIVPSWFVLTSNMHPNYYYGLTEFYTVDRLAAASLIFLIFGAGTTKLVEVFVSLSKRNKLRRMAKQSEA